MKKSPLNRALSTSGWLLTAGTVIFSGSLYLLALTDYKILGAVTPIGGGCFILGWFWIAIATWKNPYREENYRHGQE